MTKLNSKNHNAEISVSEYIYSEFTAVPNKALWVRDSVAKIINTIATIPFMLALVGVRSVALGIALLSYSLQRALNRFIGKNSGNESFNKHISWRDDFKKLQGGLSYITHWPLTLLIVPIAGILTFASTLLTVVIRVTLRTTFKIGQYTKEWAEQPFHSESSAIPSNQFTGQPATNKTVKQVDEHFKALNKLEKHCLTWFKGALKHYLVAGTFNANALLNYGQLSREDSRIQDACELADYIENACHGQNKSDLRDKAFKQKNQPRKYFYKAVKDLDLVSSRITPEKSIQLFYDIFKINVLDLLKKEKYSKLVREYANNKFNIKEEQTYCILSQDTFCAKKPWIEAIQCYENILFRDIKDNRSFTDEKNLLDTVIKKMYDKLDTLNSIKNNEDFMAWFKGFNNVCEELKEPVQSMIRKAATENIELSFSYSGSKNSTGSLNSSPTNSDSGSVKSTP